MPKIWENFFNENGDSGEIFDFGVHFARKKYENSIFFSRGDPRLNRTLADPEERIEKFVDTASNGPLQVGEKLAIFP